MMSLAVEAWPIRHATAQPRWFLGFDVQFNEAIVEPHPIAHLHGGGRSG